MHGARLFLVGSIVALAAACGHESGPLDPSLAAVRLGMTPRDVRARFVPGTAGGWETHVDGQGDTVVEWTRDPAKPSPDVEHAQFEFHGGMLVAVRARVHAVSTKETIETTPKTVSSRKPAAESGETEITILSRDCPTHHAEAEQIAGRSL